MRSFARTLVLVVVLTFLVSWGNTITSVVDSTVKNTLKVDPTQIYSQYQSSLQMQKMPVSNASWWQKVFSVTATIFESLISAFLWVLGWIAGVIVFYAYLIQKIVLYMGYALSPIFVGFFAIGSLYDIAKRYILNLVGIMLWPLGWGVAGLITQGLIGFMTDQSFLHQEGVDMLGGEISGSDAYTLQNLLGAALLGIWIIFSTIAAPMIIARSIAFGSLAGSQLMSGAARAGRAGISTATSTGMAVASAGAPLAIPAALTAGAAAGLESTASSALEMGNGSLVGSVASMGSRLKGNSGKKAAAPVAKTPFASDDVTGDKAVGNILKKLERLL